MSKQRVYWSTITISNYNVTSIQRHHNVARFNIKFEIHSHDYGHKTALGKFLVNMVNIQRCIHSDSLNLIKTKSIIVAFHARMNLMKQNVGRRKFSQFPNMSLTNFQDDNLFDLHSTFKCPSQRL